ncbi:MAG: tryptophan halogenase family protein [Wenzhouxiangellaceae bacterium]|nr:tryptophan halogenase family protein [Wenzhouxiangellaceae bacterium]
MQPSQSSSIHHLIIVGGGTAGWISAGLIAAAAARRPERRITVTLVESPDIATIGVGEGTWPTMRTTLSTLGIAESTFLSECSAAFKQGTRFVGWTSGGDDDRYYHPFTAPAGYPTHDLASHWWPGRDRLSFADTVSAQAMVCERDLAPKLADAPDYAGALNYGYHLDAGKFAALLAGHCTEQLGVRHVRATITGLESADNGDVAALLTRERGRIPGDLFIDCSGLRSMLLGDHYGIGRVDCSGVLFNDSALAVQVPYARADAPVASQTISTAQAAGWIWDIGLVHRRGVGHVYSSAHMSDDQAHAHLQRYLDFTGAPTEERPDARRISFAPGYREKFWHRNCVAVGMASGFIEPLEASALVMVELSARMIAEELPADRQLVDIVGKRFNARFSERWARIIDFLKLHYVLSRRDDSDYWRANRDPAAMPEHLADLLALWRHRPPAFGDFPRFDEIFSAASYQYVLYGMGFDYAHCPVRSGDPRPAPIDALLRENEQRANQYLARLPGHRELLDRITARTVAVAP